MGATTFEVESTGITARKAFNEAVKEARHMHGHKGYTGTIAEKDDFRMFFVPPSYLPNGSRRAAIHRYIDYLVEADGNPVGKWKPAGCIMLKDSKYLFFGWASE